MNNIQNTIVQDNEIDLYEVWKILLKRKILIFFITVMTTITATVYILTTTPIYRGSVLIELGEMVMDNQHTEILSLDNVNNLKEVTTQSTGVNVLIPVGTNNILKLSTESSNPSEIKQKLEDTIDFILTRHQAKVKLYNNSNSKVQMTQVIGDIQIESDPINPKKQLIVGIGFISGLMLGIFLAFFLEFIGTKRNH